MKVLNKLYKLFCLQLRTYCNMNSENLFGRRSFFFFSNNFWHLFVGQCTGIQELQPEECTKNARSLLQVLIKQKIYILDISFHANCGIDMCKFAVVWEGEFQSFISRRCATGCLSEPVVDTVTVVQMPSRRYWTH